MKKINTYKLAVGFIITIALILPGAANAKSHVKTIKGTIEGALCAIEGEVCPPEDLGVHLITEVNFVLRVSADKYYYLPNLNRTIKARYAGKNVRITGKVKGESIIVDTLESKEGGKYKLIWSKEKQKREFINYFETLPAG